MGSATKGRAEPEERFKQQTAHPGLCSASLADPSHRSGAHPQPGVTGPGGPSFMIESEPSQITAGLHRGGAP